MNNIIKSNILCQNIACLSTLLKDMHLAPGSQVAPTATWRRTARPRGGVETEAGHPAWSKASWVNCKEAHKNGPKLHVFLLNKHRMSGPLGYFEERMFWILVKSKIEPPKWTSQSSLASGGGGDISERTSKRIASFQAKFAKRWHVHQ